MSGSLRASKNINGFYIYIYIRMTWHGLEDSRKETVTFLGVNDKVSFFVPWSDLIRDPVSIRVLCQNCGNKCVGPGIFWDEGPISGKRVETRTPSANQHCFEKSAEIFKRRCILNIFKTIHKLKGSLKRQRTIRINTTQPLNWTHKYQMWIRMCLMLKHLMLKWKYSSKIRSFVSWVC